MRWVPSRRDGTTRLGIGPDFQVDATGPIERRPLTEILMASVVAREHPLAGYDPAPRAGAPCATRADRPQPIDLGHDARRGQPAGLALCRSRDALRIPQGRPRLLQHAAAY